MQLFLLLFFTAGQGGNIDISATEIDLNASAIQIGGGVDSVASASVGNISLDSDRLTGTDGATVINLTFGEVSGGDIGLIVDSIDLQESSPESILFTGLYTTTVGSGTGGNLSISANTINLRNAIVSSNTGGLLADGTTITVGGLGGDINIQATESITTSGIIANSDRPELSIGAGIGTTTYSASDGGNLIINTGKLTISDGASLASATFGAGNGGELNINATDSVAITGVNTEQGMNRGGLFASSGNITASTSSAPEVTGASGNISITTPKLRVESGAIVDVRSANEGDAGSIELTTDSIVIADGGTLSATTQDGAGGNIEIDTRTLQLDKGLINASVFGTGTGGNIEIVAIDSMQVIGSGFEVLRANLFDPNLLSPEFLAGLTIDQINEGILAISVARGDAGKIEIQSPNLKLQEGGLIATATAGSGAAGSIFLNTSESLVVDASFISNNTLFEGQGGDIQIDAHRLEVLQGGQITVSTLGSGDSGSVSIAASESVTVAGAAEGQSPSNIAVGAVPLPIATGNGGDLTLDTPRLNIDGGVISIGSAGSGDAGRLLVDADSIEIDNQGLISADTESGRGGNLVLNADNILWRGNSGTSATARGSGDGGNITINANNLVALENSNVTADAFMMGRGGNIQVETKGLFLCKTCQVTASSQLGVDGVVDIETLEPNNTLDVLDVSQQPTQPQEEVDIACPSEPVSTSQLTIVGRGGLPNRPQELLNARSLTEFNDRNNTATKTETPKDRTALPAPARGWYRNDRGQVMLTAQAIESSVSNSAINSADCHRGGRGQKAGGRR